MSKNDTHDDDIHDDAETQEEKRINEEYKIWKKNTTFLYDLVVTHALEWPSLTIDWLPGKTIEKDLDATSQNFILGTHTSQSEQNYLMIARVLLPNEESEIDVKKYNSKTSDHGGLPKSKVEIVQRILHDGEVHRARHMPQASNIVATKSPTATCYVFDTSKHGSVPSESTPNPLLKLKGHKKEGYGLAWSSKTKGRLASGSDDGIVCVWDIDTGAKVGSDVVPLISYPDHQDIVGDVAWHHLADNILGSVSDDKNIRIFDPRKPQAVHKIGGHKEAINCLDFSPFNENLFLSGSSDSLVKIWDLRNLKSDLHTFASHTDEVFSVAWNPSNETIFASSGSDRRVMVWDLTRIGMEQQSEDAEDGPPELLFIHGGHTAKISEFSWNLNKGDEWVIASTSEDNVVQIWQMASNIYDDEGKVDESLL